MSTLLATLLGVHVCWVAAKMQLHSAQSRPQRDYAAAVSARNEHHLPRQIVATSAVHVADQPFAGSAIILLGVRLVGPVCSLDGMGEAENLRLGGGLVFSRPISLRKSKLHPISLTAIFYCTYDHVTQEPLRMTFRCKISRDL